MKENTTPHFKLVGTMTLGPKGQVVIPASVRESMGAKPGDTMVALYVAHKQAIAFVPESHMQEIIDKMGRHIDDLRSGLPSQNSNN